MSEMTVRVVTPDKLIYDGPAKRIVARGPEGEFAVLRNHAPMMSPLEVGELRIVEPDGKVLYLAIDKGMLEVSKNHVNILSSDALLAEEIDVARIKMELEREQRAKENAKSREEQIRQEAQILRLINQLQVGQKQGK